MTALLLVLLLSASQDSSAQRLRAGQEKIKVRDFDGAIPDFERCLQLQPEEYNANFGLGICFWEKEEYRKARDHFSKVVERVAKEQPDAPLPGVSAARSCSRTSTPPSGRRRTSSRSRPRASTTTPGRSPAAARATRRRRSRTATAPSGRTRCSSRRAR
jgi:tetratricopeptide (TPR) repeat protein